MSITRINTFEARAGASDALGAFLTSILPLVAQAPGCRSCHVLRTQDNDHQFIIIETWDAIASHQAAAKLIPPETIAAVMPLLASPPSGRYYTPATEPTSRI